jgi:hypothetical protein
MQEQTRNEHGPPFPCDKVKQEGHDRGRRAHDAATSFAKRNDKKLNELLKSLLRFLCLLQGLFDGGLRPHGLQHFGSGPLRC